MTYLYKLVYNGLKIGQRRNGNGDGVLITISFRGNCHSANKAEDMIGLNNHIVERRVDGIEVMLKLSGDAQLIGHTRVECTTASVGRVGDGNGGR